MKKTKKLQKLNFFDAMALVNCGHTVKSCEDYEYKKVRGKLFSKCKLYGDYTATNLHLEEVLGKWEFVK
jgi:hypothetical protein